MTLTDAMEAVASGFLKIVKTGGDMVIGGVDFVFTGGKGRVGGDAFYEPGQSPVFDFIKNTQDTVKGAKGAGKLASGVATTTMEWMPVLIVGAMAVLVIRFVKWVF